MYILWIMLTFLLLYLVVAIKGPSVWDRLLGMSLMSAKVVLIIIVYASLRDISYFLDYAIIFVLSGFVGKIFITLFWSRKQRKGRGR